MAQPERSDSAKVVLVPENEFEEGLVLAGKMSAEALHHDTAHHVLQQVERMGTKLDKNTPRPQQQQQQQQQGHASDTDHLLAPAGETEEAPSRRQHLPQGGPAWMTPAATKSCSDAAIVNAGIEGALPATHGSPASGGQGSTAAARQLPSKLVEAAKSYGGLHSEISSGKSPPAPSTRSGAGPEDQQLKQQPLHTHKAGEPTPGDGPGGGGGPHLPPLGSAVRHVRDTVKGLMERVEKVVGILPTDEQLPVGAAAVPSTAGAGGGDTAEVAVHTAVHVLPPGVVLPPHDPAQAARERELEERRQQAAAAEAAAALLQELPSLDTIRDSARGYVDALKHSVRDRDEAAAELAGRMVGKSSYGHPHPNPHTHTHPHAHAHSQPSCMEPGGGGSGTSAAGPGHGSSSPYRGGEDIANVGGAALSPERFPPSPTGLRQLVVHPAEAAAELAGRMVGKGNYQHPHPHPQAREQHQQLAPPGIGPHTRRVVSPIGMMAASTSASAVRQSSAAAAVSGDVALGGRRGRMLGEGPVSKIRGEQASLAEAATDGNGNGSSGSGRSGNGNGGGGAVLVSPSNPPPPQVGSGSDLHEGVQPGRSGAGSPEEAIHSNPHPQAHPHPWGMRTSEDPESGLPLVALPSLRG